VYIVGRIFLPHNDEGGAEGEIVPIAAGTPVGQELERKKRSSEWRNIHISKLYCS
jgi:hypothetical protein